VVGAIREYPPFIDLDDPMFGVVEDEARFG